MKRIALMAYTLMVLAMFWMAAGCPDSTNIKTNNAAEPTPDAGAVAAVVDTAPARPQPPPRLDKSAEQLFQEGIQNVQTNQLQLALAAFDAAVKKKPNLHQAWYNIGVVNDRMNNAAKSESAYQNALRLKPNFYEAAINLSRLYLRQRRVNQAVSLLERKASRYPGDIRFRNAVIYMQIYRGQLSRSEQMARDLQRANEKDVNAIINLGLVWYKQKKYELARMAFSIAARSKRDMASPKYYLGFVHLKLNNKPAAISALQDAIKRRPDYPEAFNALGVLYLKTSKVSLAVMAFKRAVTLMPTFWEAQVNLGMAQRANQQIKESLDTFLSIKQKNPYNTDTYYYLGILYLDHNLEKGRLQPVRFISSVPSSLQREKLVLRAGQKIARYATAIQNLQTYISRTSGLAADAPARKYLADAQKKKSRAERVLKGLVKRLLKRRLRKMRKRARPAPPANRGQAGGKKIIVVPPRRPAAR